MFIVAGGNPRPHLLMTALINKAIYYYIYY